MGVARHLSSSYVPRPTSKSCMKHPSIRRASVFCFLPSLARRRVSIRNAPDGVPFFVSFSNFFFFLTSVQKRKGAWSLVTCDPLAREYSISDAFLLSNERGLAPAGSKRLRICFQFLSFRRITDEIFADVLYGALNVSHPAVSLCARMKLLKTVGCFFHRGCVVNFSSQSAPCLTDRQVSERISHLFGHLLLRDWAQSTTHALAKQFTRMYSRLEF